MTNKDMNMNEELSIEVANGHARVGDTVYHYYTEFYRDDSAFYAKKINRIFTTSDGKSTYVEYVNVYSNGESEAFIDSASSLKNYTLGERELFESKRDAALDSIESLENDIHEAEFTIKNCRERLANYKKSLEMINARLDEF